MGQIITPEKIHEIESERKAGATWSQDLVDFVRAKSFWYRMRAITDGAKDGWAPGYLWFPRPEITRVQWRFGREPDDASRPEFLRGMALWVDPRRVLNALEVAGYTADSILRLEPIDKYNTIKRAMR
ncbi:MAG: hypothetical protein E6Q97_37450 [Desulfurellales bacterium]|nr:MAG: hypothetical protein E6Q97_37450 [Desulfurellales bacterium]